MTGAVANTALAVAYVLPLALMALSLTATRRQQHRVIVAVLIILPLFYAAHFLLLKQLQGWPSDQALPAQFRLIAFEITEPNGQPVHDGEILLWIKSNDAEQPRAHRVDYSKKLHRKLIDAGRRQAAGKHQLGATAAGDQVLGQSGASEASGQALDFRDEPAAGLPPK